MIASQRAIVSASTCALFIAAASLAGRRYRCGRVLAAPPCATGIAAKS
jgi:hypothetical protein